MQAMKVIHAGVHIISIPHPFIRGSGTSWGAIPHNHHVSVLQMLWEYQERAKQLEEQVDTFRRLQDMEGKVQQLEMELQWALVIEIEKVVHFYIVYVTSMLL